MPKNVFLVPNKSEASSLSQQSREKSLGVTRCSKHRHTQPTVWAGAARTPIVQMRTPRPQRIKNLPKATELPGPAALAHDPQASHLALLPPRSVNTDACGPLHRLESCKLHRPTGWYSHSRQTGNVSFCQKVIYVKVFHLDCFLVLIKSTRVK